MALIDTKMSIETRILAELRRIISKLSTKDLFQHRERIILDFEHVLNPIVESWGVVIIGIDIIDIHGQDQESKITWE